MTKNKILRLAQVLCFVSIDPSSITNKIVQLVQLENHKSSPKYMFLTRTNIWEKSLLRMPLPLGDIERKWGRGRWGNSSSNKHILKRFPRFKKNSFIHICSVFMYYPKTSISKWKPNLWWLIKSIIIVKWKFIIYRHKKIKEIEIRWKT